jgi:hypothetical protein
MKKHNATTKRTADDSDLVNFDGLRVVEFELDVLEDKSPDVVTEAVRVEMALETHSRLDLFAEHLCDDLVEVCHDFDGELRLDAATADEIVEGICKGSADARDMASQHNVRGWCVCLISGLTSHCGTSRSTWPAQPC